MRKAIVLLAIAAILVSTVGILLEHYSSEEPSPISLYSGQASSESDGSLLDVPFILQETLYCSEASVAMVLRYYGFSDITQDYVHENISSNFEKMLPSLSEYMSGFGYANLNIPDLKDEINENDPVIIRIEINDFRHTVVVVGYTEEYIYVHDPAWGPRMKITPDNLLEYWVSRKEGHLAIILD